MRPRHDQGPIIRGLAYSSSSISKSVFRRTAARPIERVSVAFCAKHRTWFLRGVNLSSYLTLRILPNILRTGSTIFTFRVFVLANTLSFVSSSPSASRLRHIHEEESDVSYVVLECRCRAPLPPIILVLYKCKREESPFFHYCNSTQDERQVERGVDLARRPISRSVEDDSSRCVVAVQGRDWNFMCVYVCVYESRKKGRGITLDWTPQREERWREEASR